MADEKTEQETAAETAPGDNDTGVTDEMLNAAAADAVVEQTETQTEQVVEDLQTTEEVEDVSRETQETDEEGLPVDHAKRSDLGRKVSAMHRRQDDSDVRLDKLLSILEVQAAVAKQAEPDPLDDLDFDEPLTRGQIDKYLDAREKQAKQKSTSYDQTYLNTFNQLTTSLTEAEVNAVVEEMKVLSYDPSDNPAKDAEVNFYRAERTYLRKQLAGPKDKVSPITGKQKHSALGTLTQQKVVAKETALPKLDAAGASYLAFVESEDGSDKARELHKSIGKG